MSKFAMHFPVVTLSGYSAACFTDLFSTAKDFLDSNPDCQVQYEFNGQLILVNGLTQDEAWAKYTQSKFEKVKS